MKIVTWLLVKKKIEGICPRRFLHTRRIVSTRKENAHFFVQLRREIKFEETNFVTSRKLMRLPGRTINILRRLQETLCKRCVSIVNYISGRPSKCYFQLTWALNSKQEWLQMNIIHWYTRCVCVSREKEFLVACLQVYR